MDIQLFDIKVTFLTPVLGSQPQKDVATEFLEGKANQGIPDDELETLPELLEKGTTVFHRDADGVPLLYDYQVVGFLKEAGRALNGKVEGSVKNLRSKVETYLFVKPRRIALNLPDGAPTETQYLERPLRAQTMQGPRTALARSEMLPAGTWFEVQIGILPSDLSEKALRDLLDYGALKGFGQWRGGGYGRIAYTLTKAAAVPIGQWVAVAA